jgi:hypothetical protein
MGVVKEVVAGSAAVSAGVWIDAEMIRVRLELMQDDYRRWHATLQSTAVQHSLNNN